MKNGGREKTMRTTIAVVASTLLFLLVWNIWNLFRFTSDIKSVEEGHFSLGLMDIGAKDVLEFFNVTDALEVTWAHAVNSRAKLQEALAGEVMMIEADVLLRASDGTPIMAHPPRTDSDLSLAEFIKRTIGSKKGIKLDFKTAAVVEPSLKILIEETISHQQVHNPIWLNADILPGPCQSGSVCHPVDPQKFLPLCTKYFSSATLSIGWTTSYFVSVEENYYEWLFVQPMRDLLTNIPQPITFPVRANMIGRSMEQMLWLLNLSDVYTLTIWSATYDKPNTKDLVALRNKVANKARIFFDLPSDQHAKFLEDLKLQT